MKIQINFDLPAVLADTVLKDFFSKVTSDHTGRDIAFIEALRCDTEGKTELLMQCLAALATQIQADKDLGVCK